MQKNFLEGGGGGTLPDPLMHFIRYYGHATLLFPPHPPLVHLKILHETLVRVQGDSLSLRTRLT